MGYPFSGGSWTTAYVELVEEDEHGEGGWPGQSAQQLLERRVCCPYRILDRILPPFRRGAQRLNGRLRQHCRPVGGKPAPTREQIDAGRAHRTLHLPCRAEHHRIIGCHPKSFLAPSRQWLCMV